MKKYSKKIALILVLALVLATAIPALAVTQTTDITGKYEDVDLQVIVPSGGDVVLNPYSLPVKIVADSGDPLGSLTKPGQIATKPLVGVNLSEVNLNVGASVIGTPTGAFEFVKTAPSKTATTKTGQVYLQVKAVSNLGYSVGADTSTTVCRFFNGQNVLSALNSWSLPTKYNAKDKDKLIVTTEENSKSAMCTIKAGTASVTGGDIDTPSTNGYFLARLTGSIVKKPAQDWVPADGFTATITWEFEPAT